MQWTSWEEKELPLPFSEMLWHLEEIHDFHEASEDHSMIPAEKSVILASRKKNEHSMLKNKHIMMDILIFHAILKLKKKTDHNP